ncbi:hypothetical protein N0V93_010143 [Gnomoniopsis smithogilvyi]|uniref:Phosphoglycerate mutase n=1 Tax=Gnomoniopsis smithogilvyi TaxID=1191159 RepID=A0A9W8YJ46_9PEZI|nr:hypothetical protein N0V93_010143 [Gnomoniopsis smithogilvyi]
MGRAPAYIFVVRHGNRLDAANKQWHLQSPTPYDPPLTYSGWNQARAVGQRIGEILREREAQDESASTEGPPRKRRKFQVVLHSSPFLRCVQTSVGISAGLASMPEPPPPTLARASSTYSTTNPRLRPSINTDVPPNNSNPFSQPFSDLPTPPDGDSRPTSPKQPRVEKTVLRLDAFLGEWLTPGYFELITPPPGSSLMLASAKANLLRKEDYSSNPNFAAYNNAAPGAQTWGPQPAPITPVSSLDNVSSLAEALRRAGRSDSVTSVTSNGESRLLTGGAYVAPVPAYAISHNAEIPNGYVPHARDNCCHVDYQWDSMRGTLDWGDGGSMGEEWTSMHKRFRKGLQKLVDWYATADNPTQMVTKERRASVTDDYVMVDDDEEDVEIESVVVIVSHGAGCNALIGAITHQPVLTDVGLASLTEAVRKPGVKDARETGLARVQSDGSDTVSESSGLVAIHECYDLKLFASNEHLSNGRLSRQPSVTAASKPPSRGRIGSTTFTSSPLSGGNNGLFSLNSPETRSFTATANLPSMRRDSAGSSSRLARIGLNTSGLNGGITVGSGVTSFLNKAPAGVGLWSPLRSTLDAPDEEDDDFLPNFSSFDSSSVSKGAEAPAKPAESGTALEPATPKAASSNGNALRDRGDDTVSPRSNAIGNSTSKEKNNLTGTSHDEEHDSVRPLRQLGSGAGGLWGSPKPLEEEIPRDLTSPKRRWTVTERW